MATKTKPMVRTLLRESITTTAPLRVDRAKGIIYGVKILGLSSPNKHGVQGVEGTDYTPEAIRQGRSLYEGLKVNADHPDRDEPGKDRSVRDRLGKIVNTRIDADGELYGDLKLLKTHPMAETLMEAAESMPDAFGLSHNAWGKGQVENGRYVIHEIVNVRSVDIVADAGTTRSLFESEETMAAKQKKKSLRSIIEGLKAEPFKRQLLEMDGDMLDTEMPADDAAGGDWKSLLSQAIGALIASDKPEDHDMAKKILNMVRPADGGDGATVKTEESDDADEDDDKKEKDKGTMESMRRELDELKADKHCRELCESLAFVPSKVQLKALKALPNDTDRKDMVKELKESKAANRFANAPRSTPAGGGRPLQEAKEVNDGKSFVDAISIRR